MSRAEEHLKRLEQEIAELKRRDAELEQLSHTEELAGPESIQKGCAPEKMDGSLLSSSMHH